MFLAHALIDAQRRARCSSPTARSAPALQAALAADGVQLAPYAQAAAALAALPADAVLLLDPKRVTLGLREQRRRCSVVEAINPSTLLKSRKSADEAAFVRDAMAQDGAAMCEFYAWFEAALARGERITELTDRRAAQRRARARAPASSA